MKKKKLSTNLHIHTRASTLNGRFYDRKVWWRICNSRLWILSTAPSPIVYLNWYHRYYAKIVIVLGENLRRNFETNMFWFGTASSIVVRSLVTWSAFGCRQNVIAIFLFSEWLIYGIPPSPPSTSMEVFLFYMWYILIENFDVNFFFLACSRKITAM